MKFADLKKEGHLPTLFAAFLYFDFSFRTHGGSTSFMLSHEYLPSRYGSIW
jgi:hypothetical protein